MKEKALPAVDPNGPLPTPERVPEHLAIIMDGNGRWAKAQGMPRLMGHRAGVENLRRVLRACTEFGVKILTIYAFSTENWGRPESEVRGLMNILEMVIDREFDDLHANGVCLRHIGTMDNLSETLREKVRRAIELTKNNTRLTLNIAFNYGGRAEIIHAVRRIIDEKIPSDQVDEALISHYCYTAGQPDPDLIIRTSGELRVSNFLTWQGVYSEYYFTNIYWPAFGRYELWLALQHFQGRERRFGRVGPVTP